MYFTDLYIEKIKEPSFFAGDFELANSISIYNINISVYSLADNRNIYEFLKYYDNDVNNNKENFLIILCYDDKIKHYQLLT